METIINIAGIITHLIAFSIGFFVCGFSIHPYLVKLAREQKIISYHGELFMVVSTGNPRRKTPEPEPRPEPKVENVVPFKSQFPDKSGNILETVICTNCFHIWGAAHHITTRISVLECPVCGESKARSYP